MQNYYGKLNAVSYICNTLIGILILTFCVYLLYDSNDNTSTEAKVTMVKLEKTVKDFPFKIKCNGYNMSYYLVPLMADGMAYGVVPVPVMGNDGKCVPCETNNKR